MSLDKDNSGTTVQQQQTTWKNRLLSWRKSMRKSFPHKKRTSSKSNVIVTDVEPNGGQKSELANVESSRNSTSGQPNNNKVHFWRERRAERKHEVVSKLDIQQVDSDLKSTENGHSMNKKTINLTRSLDKKKYEWRKYRSNNNVSEMQKRCSQLENLPSDIRNVNGGQSYKSGQSNKNKTKSLPRPKSLSILTSLFKRSSTSRTDQNTNTNRGKYAEHCEVELSTENSTEVQFVQKSDPGLSLSSSDSLTDTDDGDLDLSCRRVKKYYSLKRSRASLIFPRTGGIKVCGRREKARTFCGEPQFVVMEKCSDHFESSDFELDWKTEREHSGRAHSRSVCFLTREGRAFSDVLPISASTRELIRFETESEYMSLNSSTDTSTTHLGYNRVRAINICSSSTSTKTSMNNIPLLGVTFIDNEGHEKIPDPLESNVKQNCELETVRNNKSIPLKDSNCANSSLEMGNQHGIHRSASVGDFLDGGIGTLKAAKSNPELYNIMENSTLQRRAGGKKNNFFSMVRGLSHSHKENYHLSRDSKAELKCRDSRSLNTRRKSSLFDKFGTRVPKNGIGTKSMTLSYHNRSLSRSVECLSTLRLTGRKDGGDSNENLRRKSTSPIIHSQMSTEERVWETADVSMVTDGSRFRTSESELSFQSNNPHDSQYSSRNINSSIPVVIPRSSRNSRLSNEFDDSSQRFSLPLGPEESDSLSQTGSVFHEVGAPGNTNSSPQHCSTPVDNLPLERQRSLSSEPNPSINRSYQFDIYRAKSAQASHQPPYVRPRIQSLEELSPLTVNVIMRKKKSFVMKTRVKHSLSVPNVDYSEENLQVIGTRYSYCGDTSGELDGYQMPFLENGRSFSAELLTSQDSLISNSSISPNDLGSMSSIISEKHLSPPPLLVPPSFGQSPSIPAFDEIPTTSPIPEESDRIWLSQASVITPGTCNVEDTGKRTSLSRNPRLGKSTGDLTFEPSGALMPKEIAPEEFFEDMDVPEAFAEALWDHVTMDPEELSFNAGDVITVISMTNIDWWFGQVGDQLGWFPAPFVRVRVSQTLGEDETRLVPPFRTRRGTNEGMMTKDDVRARVVDEILNTEKDYVKNLKDVVEGCLRQAQKRVDMFTEDQLYLLFSNIEQIYTFHQTLLGQLKDCYIKSDPCASMIGAVFLANKQGFNIYSEYCNNHPQAIAEFKTMGESNKYKHFFEACRLLQDMINISLDGFLLTPVQKICKYPLQLAELLKHTYPTHNDYDAVRQALDTMKEVASLINERKRKVENINKIAKWQSTIEGWEGENVLERSSELIYTGDVHKISNGTSQERVFFLFDHQLVYCKKDILRKNGLSYKGRIDMDSAHVTWLDDGEETYKNEPLTNAWKIYNETKNKWYVAYTKKPEQKDRWKNAFEEERRRINQDAMSGFIISQSIRQAAMRSAHSSIKSKKERATERRERFTRSSSNTSEFLKTPPSPTFRLPPPVSSADLIREENGDSKDAAVGFLQRTSALRRSFGLRGSGRGKKHNKDKRMSSAF